MKLKTPASVILALLLLVIWLIPIPVEAANLSISPDEGIVGIEVTISAPTNYGLGNYSIYWGELAQIISEGEIEESDTAISFTVPEAARGEHKVTLKIGSDSFDREFTIKPSISLSSDHGTVGSNLTVTGRGFNNNESGITITYDSSQVAAGIEASSKGSWQSTFEVPSSSQAEHIIDAEGTTPATEVDDQTFTTTPEIIINPTSGWVGAGVNIAGTGFGSGETNITVTYDGIAVKTGVNADTKGSWQSNFSVPTSSKGSHKIDAFGATTSEADVAEVNFTVSPGIKLELVSGHLGDAIHVDDSLWINGIGFERNEARIQVTFDGILVASNIVADARGSWAVQFNVPLSTKGKHSIDASGDTTKADDISDAIIIISPEIEINPTYGAIGDSIIIDGTGFGGSQAITISYDGNKMDTDSTTDTKGSFTTSFKVPESQAGDHVITITDASSAVISTSFTMESTPPATPQLLSPESGSRIGFLDKTIVTFDWDDVDDPSGVSYLLEISVDNNFSSTVFHKENLPQSQYTLTNDEALTKGEYYWRAKAIDGAGNQGNWSAGQLVKAGVMELWVLIIIAIGGIGLLAIIWRVVSISRKDNWD